MMHQMYPIFPMMIPMIPTNNMKPPTIYSLLESIVNFGKDEKASIKNLAKDGREKIFNFDYPLSEKLTKEKFECMILNHFLMRRIGFQTFTAFQIQLDVKLNEIMPMYNKMFDALDGWDIFEDGEKTTHELTDTRTTENESTSKNTTSAENSATTKANTTGENISDLRNSKLPQNQIDNVKDGKYLTEYNLNTDKNSSEDTSTQTGNSTGTSNTTGTDKTSDTHSLKEEWSKSPADKIRIYQEFQENLKSIYGMIFKDLECLFYQLV